MNQSLLKKLTSRKFIISALAALTGICALIFGENEAVQTIMGALMVILPSVVYCVMEGKIDAANVSLISSAVTDAAKRLGADENTIKSLEKIGSATASMTESIEKAES